VFICQENQFEGEEFELIAGENLNTHRGNEGNYTMGEKREVMRILE
jgi:hypothetical protein